MTTSLYLLSCSVFAKYINDPIEIERCPIPTQVKRDLRRIVKDVWYDQNLVYNKVNIFDSKQFNLDIISRSNVTALINYSLDYPIPDFIIDDMCHVIENFYIWFNNFNVMHICEECNNRLLVNSECESKYWMCDTSTWSFLHCNTHFSLSAHIIIDQFLGKETNYCDICLVRPLYKLCFDVNCDYYFHSD